MEENGTGKALWIQRSGVEGPALGPYTVEPGDTVMEVLATAGLEGWQLHGAGHVALEPEDVLYNRFASGQKLEAVDVSGLSAGIS
jgi:hypothetical protein